MAALIAVLVAAGFIGVTLYYWMIVPRRRRAAAAAWPTTDGVVRATAVQTRSQQRGANYHTPVVEYAYAVGGADYVGTRPSFLNLTWTDRSALEQELARKYPSGRKIRVRYDPSAPQNSVLDPEMVKD